MPASPTAAQSSASRADGARSRGPATPDGRARAAANAPVRHGLRGGAFSLLPGEDAAAFAALRQDLRARHAPVGEAEEHWTDELARAAWRQRRLFALEDAAMTAPLAPAGASGTADPDRLPSLATLARYRARIERDTRLAREQLEAERARRPRARAGAGAAALRWLLARAEEQEAAAAREGGTPEPDAAAAGPAAASPEAARTAEPEPEAAAATAAPLNRAQRRRLAALERRRG